MGTLETCRHNLLGQTLSNGPENNKFHQHPGVSLMTSRILSLALVATLIALAPTAVRADDWKTFKAPGDEFQIMLPGQPVVNKELLSSPDGNVNVVGYVAKDAKSSTVAALITIELPVVGENPERGLYQMVDDLITEFDGRKISVRDVKMGLHYGLEFEATSKDGKGKVVGRVFILNGKAYVLLVANRNDLNVDGSAFFNSFKVKPFSEL